MTIYGFKPLLLSAVLFFKKHTHYQWKLSDRRAIKFAPHKLMHKKYITDFVTMKLRCYLQKLWLKCYIYASLFKS